MSAPPSRVELVPPPFSPERHAVFDRIMPPGVPPLRLFTTLARVPRIYIHSRWKDEAAFGCHAGLPHTVRFVPGWSP